MPITNGVFSNRYQEQEDYEYHCGAEFFPYIILHETEDLQETEPIEAPVLLNEVKEKISFFDRVSAMLKFKFFKI